METIRRNQNSSINELFCMASQTELCKTLAISTFVEATTLINYCSMRALPIELEKLYKHVQRVTTTKRADAFEDYLAKHLLNEIEVAGFVPPVTIALKNYKLERNSDVYKYDKLIFRSDDTFLVDGLGRINTIMRIIGGYPSRIDKRGAKSSLENKARFERRNKIKDMLRSKDLAVTFVVSATENELTEGDIGQIFADINFNQEKVRPQQAMRLSKSDLLINYARDIGELPAFTQFGGMSEAKTTVTKNSKYIVTLSSIVRLIQGALGGASLQVKNAQARELPNGDEINKALIDNHRYQLNTFLSVWVNEQGEEFGKERGLGYQTNSSLLQAMGLVYFSLCKVHKDKTNEELLEILRDAATKLAKLDYGKFAEHWKTCDVMTMKKQGYSNSSGGGRTFREGLAKYLCSYLGLSGNPDMLS